MRQNAIHYAHETRTLCGIEADKTRFGILIASNREQVSCKRCLNQMERMWEYWERNNGTFGTEHRYRCGIWHIVFNEKTRAGHIGKMGRKTIVEPISTAVGTLEKGLGIPDYVVEKANEVIQKDFT